MSTKCPSCQENLTCTSDSNCWCYKFPPILPIEKSDCLCPTCLIEKIQLRIQELVRDKNNPETKAFIKNLAPVKAPQEGIDFTYNKEGLMVLTEWYHLRRGECCGSGCQECPY